MKKLVLVEWDGDRSSATGGFKIILRTKGRLTVEYNGPSYDSGEERKKGLAKTRAKMQTLKRKLGVEVTEEIIF
jgi:hypothetical protein